MKNRDINKDILKAISIGLAATLALMPNATAYAAEGDAESDGDSNDTHEESSHEESHESSETETVSEASESVAEAAAEIAQSEAPAAPEVSVAFEEAAETLGDIAADMAALDVAEAAAEEKAEYFNDMQHVADVSSGYAVEVTSEAAEAVQTADQTVDTALSGAETTKETVTEAASVTYTSASAADSAKSEASDKVDEVKEELTESQAAVEEAQDKLDQASKALDTAEDAVESAKAAKEQADEAAKKAQDAFKQLLDENGISYTEGEDGNISVDETAEITDGKIKSAIDKARSAAEKATADAEAAGTQLEEATTGALTALQEKVTAAGEKYDAAVAAYDELNAGYEEDAELEGMLKSIRTQQDKIKGIININDYWKENDELCALIAQYMLAQDDNVVRDSITVTRNSNGAVLQRIDNNSCIEISYRTADSDELHYAYYDYHAYHRDGDKVKNSTLDADHIVVLQKTVKTANTEGKATAFTGKGDDYISERDIDNGRDPYQRAALEVSRAKAAAEAAEAEKESAEKALAGYADVDAAKAVLEAANAELEAAEESFSENERAEELIDLIKAQREQVNSVKNKDNFWKENRTLSCYLVEYALIQQGAADISIGDWVTNNDTMNHYFEVTYTLDGEEKTDYFDYIVMYENGETMNSSDRDAGNFVDNSSLYKSDSSYVIDHITVVKKSGPTSPREDGTYSKFDGKGEKFFDESDFILGKDAYQSAKSRITDLQQAVDNAKAVVSVAENIQALKEQKAAADALSDEAERARQKVNDAAAALQQARITSAMDADKLADLTKKLKEAREEYDSAVEKLQEARDKVEAIETVIEEMEAALGTGFNYVTPSSETESSDRSGGSSDTSGETASVAASAGGAVTGAAVSGGTTAEAVGAEVLGERQAPAGGRTGAGSAASAESDVLGERQAPVAGDELLEEGVLGERQAPIIQAYEDGNFSRKMMFTEDGIKVSFLWWFIILILGAKGVQMYAKSRKSERAEDDRNDR